VKHEVEVVESRPEIENEGDFRELIDGMAVINNGGIKGYLSDGGKAQSLSDGVSGATDHTESPAPVSPSLGRPLPPGMFPPTSSEPTPEPEPERVDFLDAVTERVAAVRDGIEAGANEVESQVEKEIRVFERVEKKRGGVTRGELGKGAPVAVSERRSKHPVDGFIVEDAE
jgi:hypothetical protein